MILCMILIIFNQIQKLIWDDHLTSREGGGAWFFFLKKYSDSQCC